MLDFIVAILRSEPSTCLDFPSQAKTLAGASIEDWYKPARIKLI